MSSKAYPFSHLSLLIFPTKFNPLNHSYSLSLSFHHKGSSQSLHLSRKFLPGRTLIPPRKGLMGERVIKIPALGSGDGEENFRVLEQESLIDGSSQSSSSFILSPDIESTLNRLSKWLVAGMFGSVILWRHDAEAVWVAMGAVLNSVLSVILKKILNQERPATSGKSDPGMPSSHAQSITFATVFVILSMVEWLGVNEYTLILSGICLAFGSYLSWLRVAQQFHTVSQVAVGAVLGGCMSLLWVWSWDANVSDAFNSFLWVRVSILLGSAICCLGFLTYIVFNWFTKERGA